MSSLDRLQATLANSKLQNTNNAAYQAILGLINNSADSNTLVANLQTLISGIQVQIETFGSVNIIEVETLFAPVTLALSDNVKGITIFKDISGNAGANNITLTGLVDGVTNPVINTNYDVYKVFIGKDGLYHTW